MTVRMPRLRPGGHVRVIAPSRSLSVVTPDTQARAQAALAELGYILSFGRHVDDGGFLSSAPAAARLADLHEAYASPKVDAILSVIGGTRCIDILPGVDWDLLRANPKVLCGYSDVSVLLNAVWRMTGTVTFCGPHFSSFAMKDDGYQTAVFRSVTAAAGAVRLAPARSWSDDSWYVDGQERVLQPSTGWTALRPGSARGRLIGGNLSSLILLLATPYAPRLDGTVLLIEDTAATSAGHVYRSLVALSTQSGFGDVRGLIFGRFQRGSGLDRATLARLVDTLPDAYRRIPILADVETGHAQPIATFPIGGHVSMRAGPPHEIVLHLDESA